MDLTLKLFGQGSWRPSFLEGAAMEPSTESVANTAVVEGISDSSASGIEHCTKGNY